MKFFNHQVANFLDLEMLAMDLSKEICNRIKNNKVSDMTFNTTILLMLVIHSRKAINKQIVLSGGGIIILLKIQAGIVSATQIMFK